MSDLLGKKKWILVIEDEEDLCNMVVSKLKKKNYDVLSSASVSGSIQKLQNQRFDLILLDIRLSDGTGEQVIEYVRTDPAGKRMNEQTPILVMSGHMDMELIEQIRDQIQGALVKPFDGQSLLTRIQGLIK